MFVFRINKTHFKIVTLAVVFLSLAFIQNRATRVTGNLPIPLEQVKTGEKAIAVTINVDWGEEYIPKILDILDQYQAKATFFVTGRWAAKNPELLQKMAERGHLIGNHGYYHSHPDQLSVMKNKEEIMMTEKVIEKLIFRKTTFYAPPYGERGRNGLFAADQLGYTTVLWTFDTIDWRPDSTPQVIAQRIINPKLKNGKPLEKKGAIILMHPKENTVIALPRILSYFQQEGFKMVTIENLITSERSGNTTP
ncbi:MAG: Peptidoglycan-N-acetylglucosamine deacetylase [Candidatus Dichloromethanomonas elyunquensis]|nr:MAG: Peptidoglycan-N-acetylglucosamine deacetylase [Candidatus Dichloromethanomonas elyunquensis]